MPEGVLPADPGPDPAHAEPREVEVERVGYVHRRVARWLARLAAGVFLIPGGMFVNALVYPPVPGVPTSAWMEILGQTSVAAGAFLILGTLVGTMFRPARGVLSKVGDRVTVETTGLFGRKVLRMLPVRAGYIVPAGRRVRAELHLTSGDLLLAETEDDATAAKVLHVAGVDAAQQRARIRLAEPLAQFIAGVTFFAFFALFALPVAVPLLRAAPIPAAVLALWLGVSGVVGAVLGRRVGAPEITVGTDGVSYRRGLRRHFIPMAEIEDVRCAGPTITFHLRGGRTHTIFSFSGADPARSSALEHRVRDVLAARRAGHLPAQLELLDRRGRNLQEWTSSLSTLARAGSSYRAVGLSADDLAAIVVSPDVTPERRLGAALALQAAGDPAAAERIRTAAAQCASGRLRIALERVGDGAVDHAALEEALAETEMAEPPRALRR